jgi:hypothetical protein
MGGSGPTPRPLEFPSMDDLLGRSLMDPRNRPQPGDLIDPPALCFARRTIESFSTAPDELILPGGDARLEHKVQRGPWRGNRLEIHPKSAAAFDLISGYCGGRVMGSACLAVLPSGVSNVAFSPRLLALDVESLQMGQKIEMVFRNVSSEPARFRAT